MATIDITSKRGLRRFFGDAASLREVSTEIIEDVQGEDYSNKVLKNAPMRLKNRHQEMIRLSFLGLSNRAIAKELGLNPITVSIVLRSPLARIELARLKEKAESKVTDTPARAERALKREELLDQIVDEAIDVNRKIMNDPLNDRKLRSRIGMHFMDRALFGENGQDKPKQGFRDILKKLEEVKASGTVINIMNGDVNRGSD